MAKRLIHRKQDAVAEERDLRGAQQVPSDRIISGEEQRFCKERDII
jgi:hypothetical protein